MKHYTKPEIIDAILARVKIVGLRTTARALGIDAGYLCRTLNGKQALSDETAAKFGYARMETLYTKKS